MMQRMIASSHNRKHPYFRWLFDRIKAKTFQSVAIIGLALTLVIPSANSTTVIAIVRPDRITIGADAKSQVFRNLRGQNATR